MASPCKKTRLSPAPPCRQDLPDEIIEDIFARMPAKSVLQCRCLSRAWAAALSLDAFVDRHLDLANRRHREVLPRPCLLPDSVAASTVYAWSSPELGKEGVFTPLVHVPHNTRNGTLAAETRPCRGVILLRPLHRADRRAPRRPHGGPPVPGLRDYASYGLGYDARARAHKVVRLLYHDGQPAGCDVYDVGAAWHWRPEASGALPPERVRMNQAGVFAHGHVHWITMEYGREGGQAIVSFSVAAEEFGYVVAPPPRTDVDAFRLTELADACASSRPPIIRRLPTNTSASGY
ncbi:F-box domain containing protein [Panicum miliaceum]|uniref:F-box domain containing protein n=1 Tax=Panicum miliaceum TaxID=4540 RepID=A0A3L6RD30_PANMI|nr:F-box domain containing protein [Panicum miliaceum]